MSEQRRKQRQDRVGQAETKRPSREMQIWGGIVLLIVLAWAGFWYYRNHRYDGFAKCLAAKQVKMYGLYWCPHCAEQKERFGKSFQYVPYVECAIKDKPGITEQCQAAGTKMYPSWQFAGNP